MDPYLRIHAGTQGRVKLNMRQIVEIVSDQIKASATDFQYRLPPIRVLAHQLGVSKNTVSAAYDELRAQDLVESRDRKGLYVLGAKRFKSPNATVQVPLPILKTPPPQITSGFGQGKKQIMLGAVMVDPRLQPKERIASCFRSVLRSPGLADFSEVQGYRPLREVIAKRLRARGIDATADDVVTTVGSQQVLDVVSRVLVSNTIALESPSYHLGKALFELNGKKLVGLPVTLFEKIDLGKWETILKTSRPGLAYLTTNFQNPTGYSYSTEELSHILRWSSEIGFGILEDDWGSDMMAFSEFRPSLRAMGGSNVIYMNSFTKKVLPSLRLGYCVGNKETTPALVASKRVSTSGSPFLMEAAVFEFLDRGYYDAHLKHLQKAMEERYRNVIDLLESLMPDDVRWTTPGGGPVLWLECPRRTDLSLLQEKLAAKGIVLDLSSHAFPGPMHLHGFKLGYGFHTMDEMESAIQHLARFLKESMA